MKRVLLVIEKFYPEKTAITNCLETIFDECKKANIQIDVLTYKKSKELENFEIINDINIYRINDYYNMYNSFPILNIFLRIHRKLTLNSNFIHFGKKVLKKNEYQAIISCSYPFLMEKMAYYIGKKSGIPLISYQFDPYYANKLLNPNAMGKRLKEELRILSNYNKVFLPFENYYQNISTPLKELKDKYYPLELALIKKWPKYKRVQNKNFVFSYAGVFYDEIRTPFKMLDFFKTFDFDFSIYIYCIASENIKCKLNKYVEHFNGKLIVKYNQPKEECNKLLYNSDFSINIGNSISNQTPSKISELISLGKPIINFYEIDNDSSIKMLSKYGMCLNIKNSGDNVSTKIFKDFCAKYKEKQYSYDDVCKHYKSSEDVAKEFIKEVGKCCHEQN